MAGVKTTNILALGAVDEVLGNSKIDGIERTGRVAIDVLRAQIAAGEGNTTASVIKATYPDLEAVKADYEPGDVGQVILDPDIELRGWYRLEGGDWDRKGPLPADRSEAEADRAKGEADAAELRRGYAQEWASSDDPISVPAGGDGETDQSSKTWAGVSTAGAAVTVAARDETISARNAAVVASETASINDWANTKADAEIALAAEEYAEGWVIGIFADETRRNQVAWYRVESGELKFKRLTIAEISPETFEAVGDNSANDTLAWNRTLRAAALATALGPVRIVARGHYLVDQLEMLSQYEAIGAMPIQQNSIVLDFAGASLRHSGVGDGILSAEGNALTRYKTELIGGQFIAHADSKWLTRSRDLRSSCWKPEAYIGPADAIGHLAQIWRSWSENMTFGALGDNLELRQIRHGLMIDGRAEAWARELTNDGFATSGYDYKGELAADPGAASEGDFYFNTSAEEVRRYNGSSWAALLSISGVVLGISGRSFARTKIYDLLLASPFDDSANGQAIYVNNGAVYGSHINGIRGVSNNNDNSLIYWDAAFAPGTIIENLDVEKANIPENPRGYAFRVGPNFQSNSNPPKMRNVYYSTFRGSPADPKAGIVMEGEYYNNELNAVAYAPMIVFRETEFWGNTEVEVSLASNSPDAAGGIMAKALLKKANGSTSIAIRDLVNRKETYRNWTKETVAGAPEAQMVGVPLILDEAFLIDSITVTTDAAITAGTLTYQLRREATFGAGGADQPLGGTMTEGRIKTTANSGFWVLANPATRILSAGNSLYGFTSGDGSLLPNPTIAQLSAVLTRNRAGGQWANISVTEIAFDAMSASFTVGDRLIGGTSGAIGRIMEVEEDGATGVVRVHKISGAYADNETITDGAGGSATTDLPSGEVSFGAVVFVPIASVGTVRKTARVWKA
ncbi:hypothetical protein [Pelagibacterium halotolerans]|uniref:Uncharacterized protein n=1 Tax=Pelagibacterium halotolerans (strain DSM 22347 / JCM 15775 / CGMCC 1.7692 / B2) TaxID=1082931 RepID=G4RDB5_PELHB|nr:hypothetical protein [Pelagibacterium halotolerans]AEQ50741.1 hypothetical protein KKY_702 [Pelagibacterium halotolerans B2]QJR19337.1 hypothetical protein HKM20_13350 [Pelagibacterium halotolerans]SDZ94553.1 hypothetical protein SAMN05428936_101628 [Pelagibacterium halotolerans]